MAALDDIQPLTPERWDDLVDLFGPNGAYSGCWCMWFRVRAAEFDANVGDRNRDALAAIVDEGRVPGLIGYRDGVPVGWVSLAPREEFGRIERSPILKRVDDQPVWSIVCFFVRKGHRGSGVSRALLDGALAFAREHGATIAEGYPVDTAGERKQNAAMYHGSLSLFEDAGFEVAIRRKESRPIVRTEVRRG